MAKASWIGLALVACVNLGAATVSGYVHDTNAEGIANAKVTLAYVGGDARQEVLTGVDGNFNFGDNPAGLYIFKIQKPGLLSVYRIFTLTDSNRNRGYTMVTPGSGSDIEVIVGPVEDTGQAAVRNDSGQTLQTSVLSKVEAKYPAAAKQAGVQGNVEILTTISKEGAPSELRVSLSPDDQLSEAALDAVRQWRYQPVLLNGQPIEVVTKVVVNFSLAR